MIDRWSILLSYDFVCWPLEFSSRASQYAVQRATYIPQCRNIWHPILCPPLSHIVTSTTCPSRRVYDKNARQWSVPTRRNVLTEGNSRTP